MLSPTLLIINMLYDHRCCWFGAKGYGVLIGGGVVADKRGMISFVSELIKTHGAGKGCL